jgi:multisubunit Na+/H+ antiporter MnhC subunit
VSPEQLSSLEEHPTVEDTFRSNWRVIALPLILTAIVVGSALGFAFS